MCQAIQPGALLENVQFHVGADEVIYNDRTLIENTRASYPLSFISDAVIPSIEPTPTTIFFSADAHGTLPPISQLTIEQAMYYFLSDYIARIARTKQEYWNLKLPSVPASERLSFPSSPNVMQTF